MGEAVSVEVRAMTRQEWLDELVRRSREGLFPCARLVDGVQTCMYEGPEGRNCAAGVLFPPGAVRQRNNTFPLSELLWEQPELAAYLPEGVTRDMAREVQQCHDKQTYRMSDGSPWNHDEFVAKLLRADAFQGLTPTGMSGGEKNNLLGAN